MHDFGIENLSSFALDPVEFIHLASELGCGHISLSLGGGANPLDETRPPGLGQDRTLRQAVIAGLRDASMRVSLLEGFMIASEVSAGDLVADLDIAAELGARSICVVSMERDRPRAYGEIAALCDLAAERGLIVTTEFGAGTARNLDRVREMMAGVDHDNFGLLIDTMHYFRCGATLADLDLLGIEAIRHVQLCDVPMPALIKDYMEEALYERRAPGDGDLPLGEFLGRIPQGIPVGLEIPIRSEAMAGISHLERFRRYLDQAKCL
ncbi:MAG: TIM barrel protein [Novosphingobium sp.]|nr:TIM barrel protein [Novosphingobium sp.]